MKIFKFIVPVGLFLLLLWPLPTRAAGEDVLSVSKISGTRLGYSLYWPSGLGTAKIERSDAGGAFAAISETPLSYYVDYSVIKDVQYSYRVLAAGKTLVSVASDLSSGVSVISDISVESGVTNKAEASVVLKFKTDKLAKSQIYYGESIAYTTETELNNSLNQSHTILIEKLKPNTTYHFQVKTVDKSDANSVQSEDQVFTTSAPANDVTIIQIIIDALSQAFSGFRSWFQG
jgi:hypothetical protein